MLASVIINNECDAVYCMDMKVFPSVEQWNWCIWERFSSVSTEHFLSSRSSRCRTPCARFIAVLPLRPLLKIPFELHKILNVILITRSLFLIAHGSNKRQHRYITCSVSSLIAGILVLVLVSVLMRTKNMNSLGENDIYASLICTQNHFM